MSEEFRALLEEVAKEAEKYQTCMSLYVSEDGSCVELLLDSSLYGYSEWIPGEGSDICLIREHETERVIGCRLPLLNKRLCVFHNAPIRINEGFAKDTQENQSK